MDYETDEALQEIHDQMYQQEQERPKSDFYNLPQSTRYFMGITLVIIIILVSNGTLSLMQGILAGGAFFLVMRYGVAEGSGRTELTWVECMLRMNDTLKFLQKHPIGDEAQVPKGAIEIKPIGRKQWYEGQPFKRSFRVDIYDQEMDVTEIYFVEVDIYTGDIITFKHSPEGVFGDETKDIKLMPTYDMMIQKKRDKYLDKAFKKG